MLFGAKHDDIGRGHSTERNTFKAPFREGLAGAFGWKPEVRAEARNNPPGCGDMNRLPGERVSVAEAWDVAIKAKGLRGRGDRRLVLGYTYAAGG